MKHDICIEKYGVRLRPVCLEDAPYIHQLRLNTENVKYIGDTDQNLLHQHEWIIKYEETEGDYYFCVEDIRGSKLGTIGLYNVSEKEAEWGRWIISEKYLLAPTIVLILYDIAFYKLNLQSVYCRTIIENEKVVSFHDSCGLLQEGIERGGVTIRGEKRDLIVHRLDKQNYENTVRRKLEKIARFSERIM
ncbi:GNAT family N-acetyltransferase [Psychrobacillus sp. NPDC096623]|uniref:GNAT family N-acetyltransferase n=1 Tax=Psychrobacillus sp. NPDC096623 TaxID=3364492 RepID=UPI0038027246